MPRSSRATITLAILVVLPFASVLGPLPRAGAQAETETDSVSLAEALHAHRHPVRLGPDGLRGEGGRMLRERAAEATVTVLGESHGTREIPALMDALLSPLQTRGALDVLALETSPWTTARMVDSLQEGQAAYNRLLRTYPEAIPFYNLRPERDLIARFVDRSERRRPLWGLDQLFAFAGPLAFDRLEALAPSAQARRSIDTIRAAGAAQKATDARLQQLPPSVPTPITVYPPATFDTLRARFAGSAEATALLRELSMSTKIYRLNDTDNYRSNQLRAHYLRRHLRGRVEQAQAVCTGHFHKGFPFSGEPRVPGTDTRLAQRAPSWTLYPLPVPAGKHGFGRALASVRERPRRKNIPVRTSAAPA